MSGLAVFLTGLLFYLRRSGQTLPSAYGKGCRAVGKAARDEVTTILEAT
jgi:hypothetical protein